MIRHHNKLHVRSPNKTMTETSTISRRITRFEIHRSVTERLFFGTHFMKRGTLSFIFFLLPPSLSRYHLKSHSHSFLVRSLPYIEKSKCPTCFITKPTRLRVGGPQFRVSSCAITLPCQAGSQELRFNGLCDFVRL